MPRRAVQSALFIALWLVIVLVSVHDGYLMAVYRDAHRASGHEQNPLAQLLILLGGGEVWLLLAAKTCGTIVVCAILLLLYWRRRRLAWIITLAIAAFQLLLLLYLTLC